MENIGDINQRIVMEELVNNSSPNNSKVYYPDSALNNKLSSDKAEIKKDKNEFDYSKDDGKISFKDKLKYFAKGVLTPVRGIFSSVKNFLSASAVALACGFAVVATDGAILPVFIAMGFTQGAIEFGKGIYNAKNAKTDGEAKDAWKGIGLGTTFMTTSVLGAKSALKAAKINTPSPNVSNPLSNLVQCFKKIPECISKSKMNVRSRNFLDAYSLFIPELNPKGHSKFISRIRPQNDIMIGMDSIGKIVEKSISSKSVSKKNK